MGEILGFLSSLTPVLIYVILGAGAALENIVPPIPADTFVLLGGFLAARGRATPGTVFLVTWGANVASALAVYALGRRYGGAFFSMPLGHWLLKPHQLERVERFYRRWGVPAIFLTRFLPGLRAVVPVFAGVTRQRLLPVAVPLAAASAIWYGALVWLGATAGSNLGRIRDWLVETNRLLLVAALLIMVLLGALWYRSRHPPPGPDDPASGDSGEPGGEA